MPNRHQSLPSEEQFAWAVPRHRKKGCTSGFPRRGQTSLVSRQPEPCVRFPHAKCSSEASPFSSRYRLVTTSFVHATRANDLRRSWFNPPQLIKDLNNDIKRN